jgi:hypothetical protein
MLASQDSLDAIGVIGVIGVSSGSEFPITRQFIQGSGIQREPHRPEDPSHKVWNSH